MEDYTYKKLTNKFPNLARELGPGYDLSGIGEDAFFTVVMTNREEATVRQYVKINNSILDCGNNPDCLDRVRRSIPR